MNKLINVKIKGLKCDNPNCDYRNDEVKFKDYKKCINRPCPKCGHSLLTEKDFKTIVRINNTINIINKIYSSLFRFFKTNKTNKTNKRYKILMNGTGKFNIKPIKENK